MKDRAKAKVKVKAGESIKSKDMVIYAQKEKIASEYAEEIANMSPEEFFEKGRLLSELYPSVDDYDIFIRFSSGEKILCEGFFDLIRDIRILNLGFNTINLDGADLSQWSEMVDFLKCLRLPLTATSVDVIRQLFFKMKPWDLVFTVVAIHKRSLRPSMVFSENYYLDCESRKRAWDDEAIGLFSDGEIYVESISMGMDFSAHHEGEYDLNGANIRHGSPQDPRQFVQGDLSLRPVIPGRRKKGYGWTRECALVFACDTFRTSATWEMYFRDSKRTM